MSESTPPDEPEPTSIGTPPADGVPAEAAARLGSFFTGESLEVIQRISARLMRDPELLAEFERLFEIVLSGEADRAEEPVRRVLESSGWSDLDDELTRAQAAAGYAAGMAAYVAGPAGAAAIVAP